MTLLQFSHKACKMLSMTTILFVMTDITSILTKP